jgi:hypothetical protein
MESGAMLLDPDVEFCASSKLLLSQLRYCIRWSREVKIERSGLKFDRSIIHDAISWGDDMFALDADFAVASFLALEGLVSELVALPSDPEHSLAARNPLGTTSSSLCLY